MLAFLNCSGWRGVSEVRVIERHGSRREPPLRANSVVSRALEHCAEIFPALVANAEAGSGAAGPNAKPAISPGGRGKP